MSLAPSAQATIISLSLLSTQAPHVVAVGVSYKNEEATRTTVYTLEISLPTKGIGMNILLGSQVETARFFHLSQGGNNNSPFDKFIASLKGGISSGNALKVVEGWVQTHSLSLDNAMPENQAKGILTAIFGAAFKEGEVSGTYAKEVVSLLLEKQWVHDDMYPGGVLSALIKLGDWVSRLDIHLVTTHMQVNASKAVKTIPTIPSSATVGFVKKAIHLVDSPSVESVLHDTLTLPTPAPDYRAALRSSLTVEEATEMLIAYAKWLEGHVERKGEGLAGWSDDKKQKDAKNIKKASAQVVVSFEELPSLEAVCVSSRLTLTPDHRVRFRFARLAPPVVPLPSTIFRPITVPARLSHSLARYARIVSTSQSTRRSCPHPFSTRSKEERREGSETKGIQGEKDRDAWWITRRGGR